MPDDSVKHPQLFEANALLFLRRLSRKYSRLFTISDIPKEEWKTLKGQGFHWVWLMGLWKRSQGARQMALKNKVMLSEYDQALPGWRPQDVLGSPYAIYDYSLDPLLGRTGELEELRKTLNEQGLKLMADYVPNHLALDHPLTQSSPEMFIRVSESDFYRYPDIFYQASANVYLAHGKDPYFPAWNDSVQINYYSPKARQFTIETLLKIAENADGVRCDMAMLGIHRIFEANWKNFLQGAAFPKMEFWKEVIAAVKSKYPKFVFMAEAYWNLEWELQQMGFDYTYDKKLYDRLLHASPATIRGHLWAEKTYQEKSVRFIENHDEKRAASAFGLEKSFAAASVIATIPGMRFFYDGQTIGKKIHSPIQLAAEPIEQENTAAIDFYRKLLGYSQVPCLHRGAWKLLDAGAVKEGIQAFENILAWGWRDENQLCAVIINYSDQTVQARVRMPIEWFERKVKIKLFDHMNGQTYERDIKELTDAGLYVELGPWKQHLLECRE